MQMYFKILGKTYTCLIYSVAREISCRCYSGVYTTNLHPAEQNVWINILFPRRVWQPLIFFRPLANAAGIKFHYQRGPLCNAGS